VAGRLAAANKFTTKIQIDF